MAQVALGEYGEQLVKDDRLEKVFYQLQRLVEFPFGMQFATQLQEPVNDQGMLAVFFVTSPHPRKNKNAMSPETLVSVAQMPYKKWQEANARWRHYAGLTDPLRPIFAGLLRQHMAKRKGFEELN